MNKKKNMWVVNNEVNLSKEMINILIDFLYEEVI